MKRRHHKPAIDPTLIVVDPEDQWIVDCCSWSLSKVRGVGALQGWINGAGGSLASFIMKPPKGLEPDHINRNPFDNRKKNLRVVTHPTNLLNNGAFNVVWNRGSFRAKVMCQGVVHSKSGFKTHEEAKEFALQIKMRLLFAALKETRELNLHLADEEYYKYTS